MSRLICALNEELIKMDKPVLLQVGRPSSIIPFFKVFKSFTKKPKSPKLIPLIDILDGEISTTRIKKDSITHSSLMINIVEEPVITFVKSTLIDAIIEKDLFYTYNSLPISRTIRGLGDENYCMHHRYMAELKTSDEFIIEIK